MQEKIRRYRGWTLVETGHRYYSACKGPMRAAVGSIRRGDFEDMYRRFKRVVDQIEGARNEIRSR